MTDPSAMKPVQHQEPPPQPFDVDGAYVPALPQRKVSRGGERLRESVADWSAGLAAVSDLPATVRQDVADALDLARRFNAVVVRPQALQLDLLAQQQTDFVPHELIRRANEWGLFTLWLPALFGGKGWNFLSLYAFLEEVSTACVGVANVIGAHYMGVATLTASWNLRLAEEVFADVCRGERDGEPRLISLALSEPGVGHGVVDTWLLDRASPTTWSTRQPDGSHLLHGHKNMVSNGHAASWHLVVTWEDVTRPSDTLAVLAVRAGTSGVQLGDIDPRLGQRACVVSDLGFDACLVPARQVALDRTTTSAFRRPHREVAQVLLDYIVSCTRAGVAAFSAGVARGAFEAARDYAARKTLPGGRLIERPWAQSLLADMGIQAALARQAYLESAMANGLGGLFRMMFFRPLYWADQLMPLGLWRFAARRVLHSASATRWFQRRFLDAQPPEWQRLTSGLASMAKVAASDIALRNAQLALELAGPDGLRHELGMEKRFRDALELQRQEGSNDLNRGHFFRCRWGGPDEPGR